MLPGRAEQFPEDLELHGIGILELVDQCGIESISQGFAQSLSAHPLTRHGIGSLTKQVVKGKKPTVTLPLLDLFLKPELDAEFPGSVVRVVRVPLQS